MGCDTVILAPTQKISPLAEQRNSQPGTQVSGFALSPRVEFCLDRSR